MIIDTKWKRMTPRIDDPKQGVSQGDVYQLMAYSQLYDCDHVMLLYPHHHGLLEYPTSKPYVIASSTGTNRLFVSTVDVSARPSVTAKDLEKLVSKTLSPSNRAAL